MVATVKHFGELTADLREQAGGKGATLARLYQDGFPVPEGFVILPGAFAGHGLAPGAREMIHAQWHALRVNGETGVAVRSSALQEDSTRASFAGGFETVLDVHDEVTLWDAIEVVQRSRESERVQAYAAAHGMEASQQIAVVVQRMAPSELAGVLFTADPVSGSYQAMVGNFVEGLGDTLVSGEADAQSFRLRRPKGEYEGPTTLECYASDLFKLALRLEKALDGPQDIEWAVGAGELHLLQARPVTTLSIGNLDTYQINESLREDTLWVNTNVAEAVPDVFSPLTWSLIRSFDKEFNYIPGYFVWSGNIYGRVYSNIGRRVSAIAALTGWDNERILGLLGDMFGQAPPELVVPVRPMSRGELLGEILPRLGRVIFNMIKARLTLGRFLRENPQWSRNMSARIATIGNDEELLQLWHDELRPYAMNAWWAHTTGASGVLNIMALERQLTKLVGKEDANALLSNLRGDGDLPSLGPVVGISAVLQGTMTREAYLQKYGHRGPHEFELSIAHPAEDRTWLEEQIESYKKSNVDVGALLARQRTQFEAAKARFAQRYPRKVRWLEKRLAGAANGARSREAARSEFTRVFRIVRAFALRAGELAGLDQDVFFLYVREVEDLLAGRHVALQHIPERKKNYERYKTLPSLPSIIRGRFNVETWMQDSNRRIDYYDPGVPPQASHENILRGVAGAAGRVRGKVRVLHHPEEGAWLQSGEILVAATTNVGWTPLFPRAAAIVTDIGAPLSHAAIVARELGIPAVVGCGNATTRLKTGQEVLVDGGQGVVYVEWDGQVSAG